MIWRFNLEYGSQNIDLEESSEPIGWQNIELSLRRDLQDHGVFYEFTARLQFIREGFNFILDAYQKEGISANIILRAYYQCGGNKEIEAFKGLLAMPTLQFTSDFKAADIRIEQITSEVDFKNNKGTDINLNGSETLNGEPLTSYQYAGYDLTLEPNSILRIDRNRDYNSDTENLGDSIFTNDIKEGISHCVGCNRDKAHNFWATYPFNVTEVNEIGGFQQIPSDQLSGSFDNGDVPPANYIAQVNSDIEINLCFCFRAFLAVGTSYSNGNVQDYDWSADLILELGGTAFTVASYSGSNGPKTLLACPIAPTVIPDSDQIINDPNNGWNVGFGNYAPEINDCISFPISKPNIPAGSPIKLYWDIFIDADVRGPVPLTQNPEVCFYWLSWIDGACNSGSYDPGFTVKVADKLESTQSKVWLVNEALARNAETITDNKLTVYSEYFGRPDSEPYSVSDTGCGALTAITNGFHLRGFPADKAVFINWEDFFGSLKAAYNVGYGIVKEPALGGIEVIRVEPSRFFYDDTGSALLDLSDYDLEAANYSRKINESLIITAADFGYKEWANEAFNNLDEFNSKRGWKLGSISKVENRLEQISDYLASGYTIELTRRERFSQTSSKDYEHDQTKFLIRVNGAPIAAGNAYYNDTYGLYKVIDRGVDISQNILLPNTVTNWPLSPWHMAKRWQDWLLTGAPEGTFNFEYGEANYIAAGISPHGWNICTINYLGLDYSELNAFHYENDNISYVDSDKDRRPFLKPELVSLEIPLSIEDWLAIKANPYGYILIRTLKNTVEKAFIKEIKYKINDFSAKLTLIPNR